MSTRTVAIDADAIGIIDLAALANAQWTSIASSGCFSLCSADASNLPAGLYVVSISGEVTAGSVAWRVTGSTDVGAAGDALGSYQVLTGAFSIPLRGVRDFSAPNPEPITRVCLRPNAATGRVLVQWARAAE